MSDTYCEMTIQGQPEAIKAFVLGFIEGRGGTEESVIEGECLIEEDSPIDLIKHFFGPHHHTVPVIIGTDNCQPLRSALEKHKAEIRGTVTALREITGASFNFRYRTFSRETEKSLFDLFTNPAEGVRIQDYAPKEKLTPEGKGVEAYAPLHDYEVSAQGTVSGGVKEVYALFCRAGRFDVVELGELKLSYGKNIG